MLKGLFIIKGYNIYEFEIPRSELLQISKMNQPFEINLERTKSFGFLIENLDKLLDDKEEESAKKLKKTLKTIKEEGDGAVHRDETNDNEVDNVKEAKEKLNKLFEVQAATNSNV